MDSHSHNVTCRVLTHVLGLDALDLELPWPLLIRMYKDRLYVLLDALAARGADEIGRTRGGYSNTLKLGGAAGLKRVRSVPTEDNSVTVAVFAQHLAVATWGDMAGKNKIGNGPYISRLRNLLELHPGVQGHRSAPRYWMFVGLGDLPEPLTLVCGLGLEPENLDYWADRLEEILREGGHNSAAAKMLMALARDSKKDEI